MIICPECKSEISDDTQDPIIGYICSNCDWIENRSQQ